MNIAINGFGRIGRAIFKIALEKGLNVKVINDVHGVEDAVYLLKYDSVYGKYGEKVEVGKDFIVVAGKKIKVIGERDPLMIQWRELGVDVVVEATGAFRERAGAEQHLKAGAKHVIVTAPMKNRGADLTVVLGVNDNKLKKEHKILSVASCTTNCLAPMAKVLNESFGIEKAFMTTVHAYTSSQALVDDSARKPTRGRAAGVNIVPTTTGASEAVIEVIPEMKGKLDGIALRVPVACGSITDLTAIVKKKTNAESVNKAFMKYSNGKMKGILACSDEPLVSSDIVGTSESAILLLNETKVNENLVKVMAWYDNEYGYSCRVADVIKILGKWVK